jgi:hypothetical protein
LQTRQISSAPEAPIWHEDSKTAAPENDAPRPAALAALLRAPDIATPLRDGHYGCLRDGTAVGPLRALDPGGLYAYACGRLSWTADGRFDATSDEPHPHDLIRVRREKLS